jgi:hypothetical protein
MNIDRKCPELQRAQKLAKMSDFEVARLTPLLCLALIAVIVSHIWPQAKWQPLWWCVGSFLVLSFLLICYHVVRNTVVGGQLVGTMQNLCLQLKENPAIVEPADLGALIDILRAVDIMPTISGPVIDSLISLFARVSSNDEITLDSYQLAKLHDIIVPRKYHMRSLEADAKAASNSQLRGPVLKALAVIGRPESIPILRKYLSTDDSPMNHDLARAALEALSCNQQASKAVGPKSVRP